MSDTSNPTPAPEPIPAGTPALSATPSAVPAGGAAAVETGLPEWEPLTAEIVAEEAERGDFVMQWAVVLLGILFASFLITDSKSLVHIKSGQYLLSNGGLPPAKDVFSYTAADRPWINLNWLFDLIVGGTYSAGGFIAVCGLKALLAGIGFGCLVHITRPGISTWWGSICAALTVIAWHSQLSVQPQIVTLLGLSVLCWLWWNWKQTSQVPVWSFVVLMAVWANLDPRAWIGPVCLLLYGLGDTLGAKLGFREGLTSEQRRRFWQLAGLSCAALLLNPHLWQTWLSPFNLYGTYYPAVRSYSGTQAGPILWSFPLWSSQFLSEWQVSNVLSLVLIALALGLQIANAKRLDLGLTAMWLGCCLLAVGAAQQLPVAALVSCVVATLTGQAWYAANYSLEYTTSNRGLIFSRGGRAITVLGLFAMALLVVVGRLRPADNSTIGWGIKADLQGILDSYADVLKDSPDDRPFNLSPSQGDFLIWTGQKCFIDQRLELFTGTGETDLIATHKRLRDSLRLTPGDQEQYATETAFWKTTFDSYQITHVVPRLTGGNPDYRTMTAMLISPDWILSRVGSATGTFYRSQPRDKTHADYLAKNQFDFGLKAFRSEAETIPPRNAWVQLPTFYQRYIWGRETNTPAEVVEARHLLQLSQLSLQFRVPRPQLAYQAIRRAQAGLAKNPNDASAYVLLGVAYQYLLQVESLFVQSPNLQELRYFQAVQSLQQAVTANPDDLESRSLLAMIYQQRNKVDLALRELTAIDDALQKIVNLTDDQIQAMNANLKAMEQLSTFQSQIEKQAEEFTKAGQRQPAEIAVFYGQQGMTLKGLSLLEQLSENDARNPEVMILSSLWMLESGRIEEAYLLAGQLQAVGEQTGLQNWQMIRCLTLLANGEYGAAGDLWTQYVQEQQLLSIRNVLMPAFPRTSLAGQPPWPLALTAASMEHFYRLPQQTAALELRSALIYMEAGQAKRAIAAFRNILKSSPDLPERPLVAMYLNLLTGEEVNPLGPAEEIPLLFAK